jgi:prepilin-type N-terminal cleavage/methylation domain-containing protein
MGKKAFTLLEIIIVIIIVGVLTSLALPRLMKMVEGARSAEALSHLTSIRDCWERCYLMKGTYGKCAECTDIIEESTNAPGAHFQYSAFIRTECDQAWFMAERNTYESNLDNSY